MEIYKSYREIVEKYLNGRKIERLDKAELYTLSRLVGLEPNTLPASYHTKNGLVVWINNWLTLEIIEKVATDAANERRN